MIRSFRTELKYLIHHSVRPLLLERWSRFLTKDPHTDAHAVTPILSQYYDSPTLAFYHDKIAGIGVRKKVRLRTYGYRFKSGQPAFLEIKQRLNDRVRKIRVKINDFSELWLDPAHWSFDDTSDRDWFADLIARFNLRPTAQVWYLREAYQGVVETDMRVTLDTCLTGLFPGERLSPHLLEDGSRSLMPETLVILEIKATGRMPTWVTDGIIAAELSQATISKYVIAVDRLGMAEFASQTGEDWR